MSRSWLTSSGSKKGGQRTTCSWKKISTLSRLEYGMSPTYLSDSDLGDLAGFKYNDFSVRLINLCVYSNVRRVAARIHAA